jgi:outer membrane biosynthesis protein TonB
MPDSLPRMPLKGPLTTERRQNPRHPVRPTEYVEIGDSNGGIILDISEGGMAVASAQALVGNQTLTFRFQLPRSLETIETSGEINWIGETKKRAGVRFVDLPVEAREQIHKWIDSQTSGYSNGEQKSNGSAMAAPSPKISRELPRYEPVNQDLPHQEPTAVVGHNPSKNLNPVSYALSSPLDEPEIDESEPEYEEKSTAASNAQPLPERRAQCRLPMTASTYVQLSDGNGGLMANLNKAGFCVRAAKVLETDHLPVVRFQLPNAHDFVESSAWIVWKSPSKKTVGARFESLSDEAQSQIAQWIDSQPLPKSASIKNPLSKNRPSPNPIANSPLEQRERISSSPKTTAPITATPLTLMSPDSVPIPAYISPLAISLDAPAVSSPNNSSSTTASLAIPTPAPIKPAAGPSAPASPRSQRPFSAPLPIPVSPTASTKAFPAAPRVVSHVLPPIFNEPDWSVAPQRPTGYWKTAAMIVLITGTLFGAAILLRSKKSATPASQETTEYSSIAASTPAATPSTEPISNSSATNSPSTNSSPTNQPTPSSTAPSSNPGSNSPPSREFYDTPRKTTSAKSSPKGDEQFVDEPRAARSQPQVSSPSIQSNTSPAASDQPATSVPTPVQSGAERNQNPPTEEGSGFPTVVHRVQSSPTPSSSNTNGEAASTSDSSSPPPTAAGSRNQQPATNLASAAGVSQNSAAVPAASTTATIPNPVPTVSVFSRFRAIRNTSDAPRPEGSDLQIGRLKSGPVPSYPIEAQRQQIQGIVELEVLVGADGNILTVHLVKGPPELASVAMGTVRSWQYGQTTLGGHPVETDQSIYFTFKLTK